MAANPERRSSNAGMDASRVYPPELLPLLQSLLATVADIDFEHESDVETVRNSSADEWLKQTTIRKLQECHRERRILYIQQLESLQRRLRLWLPDCELEPLNSIEIVQGTSGHTCQNLSIPSRFLTGFPKRLSFPRLPRSGEPVGGNDG